MCTRYPRLFERTTAECARGIVHRIFVVLNGRAWHGSRKVVGHARCARRVTDSDTRCDIIPGAVHVDEHKYRMPREGSQTPSVYDDVTVCTWRVHVNGTDTYPIRVASPSLTPSPRRHVLRVRRRRVDRLEIRPPEKIIDTIIEDNHPTSIRASVIGVKKVSPMRDNARVYFRK